MEYNFGSNITIDNIIYKIVDKYDDYYKIKLNDKYGLIDKKTLKLVVETIYDNIWIFDKYYEIVLNNKHGLIYKKTCKVILNPEYKNVSHDELVKIYDDLVIKSKMRVEKLKQLEEML
jgi:hypothetical protein